MTEFYDEVAKALGVTDLSPLRPGGQKRVFAAKRGNEDVVLKAVEVLPPRQAEVLEWVAKGYVNKEIADRLGISLETVRSYLKSIYEKLHVRSRTEAAMKFFIK